MSYSPAAILTIYAPNNMILDNRLSIFYNNLAVWMNQQIITSDNKKITNETLLFQEDWLIRRKRRGFLKLDIFLWITYFDGEHENVCLDLHRGFLNRLVKDNLVDLVNFPKGSPRKILRWFSSYESGFVFGRRYLVAIDLLQSEMFLEIESLVRPVNSVVEKNWDQLSNDKELVSIDLKSRKKFLEGCKETSFFDKLSFAFDKI